LICEWQPALCSESHEGGDRAGPRPDDEAEEAEGELEAIFKGQKNKERRGSQVEGIKGGFVDLLPFI
jgi:hypothetical protein